MHHVVEGDPVDRRLPILAIASMPRLESVDTWHIASGDALPLEAVNRSVLYCLDNIFSNLIEDSSALKANTIIHENKWKGLWYFIFTLSHRKVVAPLA